jgi:hypothetical protein
MTILIEIRIKRHFARNPLRGMWHKTAGFTVSGRGIFRFIQRFKTRPRTVSIAIANSIKQKISGGIIYGKSMEFFRGPVDTARAGA